MSRILILTVLLSLSCEVAFAGMVIDAEMSPKTTVCISDLTADDANPYSLIRGQSDFQSEITFSKELNHQDCGTPAETLCWFLPATFLEVEVFSTSKPLRCPDVLLRPV